MKFESRSLARFAGIALLGAVLAVSLFMGACRSQPVTAKRLLVLAIDGMDYGLLRSLMAEGKMPHFQSVAQQGTLVPLATTIPPQSPVAWSSFITGMNPGQTGIFDFIHRDPDTMLPFLSTSRVEGPGLTFSVGKWVIPLSGGEAVQLRKGTPWWVTLEENGIPATVIKIPANFPPTGQPGRILSGMGTPDLQGTYGRFSFFTTDVERFGTDLSGGEIKQVTPEDHIIHAVLTGPTNTFRKERPRATAEFAVYIDPENPLAKIRVGEEEVLLQQGEWSDWVRVEFPLIPYFQSVTGICRFYLQQVRPDFQLYVSPMNLDPASAALPISSPPEFASRIAEAVGPYYTQGMPEDTKALTDGIFRDQDFLRQAEVVFRERRRMYEYFLERFASGVLFFYFSSLDQISHVMWRTMDPDHPAHDPVADAPRRDAIAKVYRQMDTLLGKTLKKMGDDTAVLVLSDHGFAPWYRAFHLNTWLKDQGYLVLRDPGLQGETAFLTNVDWSRTRAYGLGINALYLNLLGRESTGIVPFSEREALEEEIANGLLAYRDPENRRPVIARVYKSSEIFSGSALHLAPDLIVGFHRGYRNSNESSTGRVPRDVLVDNLDKWSGDHCMAADQVPGILLSNRKLQATEPQLVDLAPSILAEFGIRSNSSLEGRPVW